MKITGPSGAEITSFDEWRVHAGPKKPEHWKDGRSAAEAARAWCPESGPCVPAEIQSLMESHPDIGTVQIEAVYPERRVRFDDIKGEPRNADVVAVGKCKAGTIAISIEAKTDEPFDLLVGEVIERGKKLIEEKKRTGSIDRVEQLLKGLFGSDRSPDDLLRLRYQLLTGVAGAISAAQEEKAQCAAFIVHEFVGGGSESKRATNAKDLDQFIAMLSKGDVAELRSGTLLGPIPVAWPAGMPAVPLYVGKARR